MLNTWELHSAYLHLTLSGMVMEEAEGTRENKVFCTYDHSHKNPVSMSSCVYLLSQTEAHIDVSDFNPVPPGSV